MNDCVPKYAQNKKKPTNPMLIIYEQMGGKSGLISKRSHQPRSSPAITYRSICVCVFVAEWKRIEKEARA